MAVTEQLPSPAHHPAITLFSRFISQQVKMISRHIYEAGREHD
ncbi:hypothetical protein THPR109532_14035 [Thalassospira profundimaris]